MRQRTFLTVEAARKRYDELKQSPSPRKFYAFDLNHARREMIRLAKCDLCDNPREIENLCANCAEWSDGNLDSNN